jgi:acetyltransferase-like isoleucine patch superfamily enzyme
MLKKIKKEVQELFCYIISVSPSVITGNAFRRIYWKKKIRIGKNPLILRMVKFEGCSLIEIGDNFVIGDYSLIDVEDSKGIYIGSNVSIASGTYIRAANHNFSKIDVPIQKQGHYAEELKFHDNTYSIIIEDDVWIGARAILLSGSHIGKGSIISAGSVVSRYVAPYSIVVGNPGRVVANRITRNELK